MIKVYKIKQGLDIKLKGKAESIIKQEQVVVNEYALKPTDFPGLTPRVVVREGDSVKAGTPLFYDKYQEKVKFVSPVSGIVKEVRRGERRKVLEVIITPDEKAFTYETFEADEKASPEEIKEVMLKAGIFPSIKQRPYDVIANPEETPRAIFVSTFDTAPLGLDYDFIIRRELDSFKAGLRVLSKLAPLYVNLRDVSDKDMTEGIEATVSVFKGKHPASNVGVQINKIAPINKGETIWTIAPQDVIILGRLFLEKKYDARIVVALSGSEVIHPIYYSLYKGVNVQGVLKGNLKDEQVVRVISGNTLVGTKIEENGFLGFYDNQLTVIPEGAEYEFLGWIRPGFGKMSVSRSFFSWLVPNRKYNLSANTRGEERAFVMSGEYERVFPMDIMPVQLLKAILAKDIDKMEQLGIYDVAPEDFSLCEFVCTSKIESQRIVREGLDYLRNELR